MKIFTDTSGLFRNDVMHDPAKATLTALLETGTELHTTSYVLQETLALLQARISLDAAIRFEHDLPNTAVRSCVAVYVDEPGASSLQKSSSSTPRPSARRLTKA